MPDRRDGRRFFVPPNRRLSWDLLHFSRQVPLCGHDRIMDLTACCNARANCHVRVSWAAVFLKAYGLVARDCAELRQTWYRWPWAHLYQHPHSVGSLAVQRTVDGVPWLFWGRIDDPAADSLLALQQRIDDCTQLPVDVVFRRQWQIAHLPTPIRRLIWWINLNLAWRGRSKRLGTFFLSSLAGRGAEIQLPPAIQTGCLTYGPLDEQQRTRVTLAYDHRVMDGVLVAEVLQRLEAVLNTVLVQELDDIALSRIGS